MVKIDDEYYFYDGEKEIDLSDYEKIGEIEYSYDSILKSVEYEDPNFSSNSIPLIILLTLTAYYKRTDCFFTISLYYSL